MKNSSHNKKAVQKGRTFNEAQFVIAYWYLRFAEQPPKIIKKSLI